MKHTDRDTDSGGARKYIWSRPTKLTLIYKHKIYVVINGKHKVVQSRSKFYSS